MTEMMMMKTMMMTTMERVMMVERRQQIRKAMLQIKVKGLEKALRNNNNNNSNKDKDDETLFLPLRSVRFVSAP